MEGPGDYVAEVTEGISRVEDLPPPGSSGGTGSTGGGVVRSAGRRLGALERPDGSCPTWAMHAAAGP